MRFLLMACCALLGAWAAMAAAPLARDPGGKGGGGGGGGGGGQCPANSAQCQVNAQVFNFGRAEMNLSAPPVNTHGTVSVTCTRAVVAEGRQVDVAFQLKALPPAPSRQMRDRLDGAYLRYDMFIDPARTRYWGDGESHGTFAFEGALFLDNRNKVGTVVFPVYGRVDGGQVVPPGPFLGAVVTRLEYSLNCR